MPKSLVECIPNFSEARRPEVVQKIVAAIESVNGVRVLDRHSDLDHNRTVITMVGEPGAVEEAAFRSIKIAAELINLDEHDGAHPRIGATDVVPFVPISGMRMEECIEMAHRLGKRVGEQLNIPVYLYEEAATRPDRQNLEVVRKGQYEGLKEEINSNPDRKPDFGPAKLGTAGATVIGARAPLIAFNVYLTTNDLAIAQKIAKAMRNSSGGYRFIKAMGVIVDERAQVSMNMTNFRQTPIARVVESVRREAERFGVGIHHSELVGLIPQDALIDAAVWYTQLDGFKADQVLESRLYENSKEQENSSSNLDFLDQLAAANPTPGGGSAAAFTGAQAAALTAMVGRLTIGKKKYTEVESLMQGVIQKADHLRVELTNAVSEDSAAFEAYMNATRLPKETPEEQSKRSAAMQAATIEAARVPYKVAEWSFEVLNLALLAVQSGNLNAISDGFSSANLAHAALKSAAANVLINIHSLQDSSNIEDLETGTRNLLKKAAVLESEITSIFYSRSGVG